MPLIPDDYIWWRFGLFELNSTILYTWIVMAFLSVGSWLVTRRLRTGVRISRIQHVLEVVVHGVDQQLREISPHQPKGLLPFLGTLFLFIAVCNLAAIVPGFESPAGSLSTTAGLSICVFVAVPIYGIGEIGWARYLRNYLRPTPFMLPFNIMGELSRTLALSVRLFGNVMSSTMIGAILLIVAPLIFPILMQLLGLLTGLVQAYIFAILAAVYISAGKVNGILADAEVPHAVHFPAPESLNAVTKRVQETIGKVEEWRSAKRMENLYLCHHVVGAQGGYAPVFQKVLPLDTAWVEDHVSTPWPNRCAHAGFLAGYPVRPSLSAVSVYLLLPGLCPVPGRGERGPAHGHAGR